MQFARESAGGCSQAMLKAKDPAVIAVSSSVTNVFCSSNMGSTVLFAVVVQATQL
jgi:hypothetical protein